MKRLFICTFLLMLLSLSSAMAQGVVNVQQYQAGSGGGGGSGSVTWLTTAHFTNTGGTTICDTTGGSNTTTDSLAGPGSFFFQFKLGTATNVIVGLDPASTNISFNMAYAVWSNTNITQANAYVGSTSGAINETDTYEWRVTNTTVRLYKNGVLETGSNGLTNVPTFPLYLHVYVDGSGGVQNATISQ